MRRAPLVALAAGPALLAGLLFGVPASAQVIHADSGSSKMQDVLPSDPSGAVERARKQVAAGQLSAAIKELDAYVSAHPREVEPARYLGDLFYRSGDLGAAERVYLAILRQNPGDRKTHDRLGGVYAAQDRSRDAMSEFQASLPETYGYAHLVQLHRRLGDLDKYVAQARAAADADPNNSVAQFAIGTIDRQIHRPEEAAGYLERANLLEGRMCPVLSELGSAYLDLNRVADAKRVLGQCLAYEPDDYAALVNMGEAYLVLPADAATARSYYEHANRVRPEGAEALIDLGYVEDLNGHWEAAVGYYLRSISADPMFSEAYFDLGYDYDQRRYFALAEAALLKGLTIAPSDGRLHYMLARTYADQGKRDLARAEYQRATSSDEPEIAGAAAHDLSALQ